MDAKLKAKLTEAIEKAYERRDKLQMRYSLRTKKGAQNVPFSVQKLYHLLHVEARRNMVRARLWRKIETALAQDSVERLIGEFIRKHQRSAEDEAQLRLPGFEYLPARIRAGRQSLIFARATVAQFLAYKARYEQRAEKDQRVMDELRRLAESVGRFADGHPGLTIAEALERAQGTGGAIRLVVAGADR
jgi:hypothetical protein